MKKNRLVGALAIVGFSAGITFVAAPAYAACSSGYYCGWDGGTYGGTNLITTNGAHVNNAYLDIADDLLSSAENYYSNRLFCAWSHNAPWGDFVAGSWAANTAAGVTENNKADYIRARTTSGC